MNLDAYCDRIGYRGPRLPSLPVLREVVFCHACTIPFENLSVLLGRGVPLDDDAVERKLVHDRRGGYCFEQNSLLMRALAATGFDVTRLAARVRLNQPRDFTPPRTHLFLRVDLDGLPWVVDVGVGGTSLTAPIRLDVPDGEQSTPHESRRIVREPGNPFPRYIHQTWLGGDWADVYEFTLEQMPAVDLELANWWTSTSPNSHFRHNLLVGVARPDGTRYGLRNREFVHRRGAEVLDRQDVTDADQLLLVLAERFGLVFPAGTRFGVGEQPWPT